MPSMIRAIDLLLLSLTNVIIVFLSDENKTILFMFCSIFATFYFDPPCPLKVVCTFTKQTHKFETSRKLLQID
jgi:hypothetical protein